MAVGAVFACRERGAGRGRGVLASASRAVCSCARRHRCRHIPRATELGPDYHGAFTLAVSALCAALVGLMPAIRGARAVPQATLRDASLTATANSSRLLFRRTLVAAEVALTVMLLLGAGLMLRSMGQLAAVDPGFEPDGLVTASLALPVRTYPEARRSSASTRAARAPGEYSGFTSVSAGSTMPCGTEQELGLRSGGPSAPGRDSRRGMPRPSSCGPPTSKRLACGWYADGCSRQRTTRLAAGGRHQRENGRSLFCRGGSTRQAHPGRRRNVNQAWMTIVGISGDVRTEALDVDAPPAYTFCRRSCSARWRYRAIDVTVRPKRRRTDPPRHAAIRTAVRELDPSLAVHELQTGEAVVQQSVARPRFTTALLSAFAVIACSSAPAASMQSWLIRCRAGSTRSAFVARSG